MTRLIRSTLCIATACLLFTQTGCLKTRAQLKQQNGDAAETDDNSGGGGAAPARPTARYEMDEIKHEVTRISGKVEELDHASRSQNVSELKEYVTRLDGRIAELEKNQILALAEIKALKDDRAAAQTAAREAARPATDLMSEANQLLAERKCDEAVEKFKTILTKNAKGKDTAEAHFGLGESQYCLKDYKKAIVQYSKVQEVNAKSARVPAALYRIALAFQHLNMPKESKGFFSELVERYPKSPEAKKARAKAKE